MSDPTGFNLGDLLENPKFKDAALEVGGEVLGANIASAVGFSPALGAAGGALAGGSTLFEAGAAGLGELLGEKIGLPTGTGGAAAVALSNYVFSGTEAPVADTGAPAAVAAKPRTLGR